MDAMVRNKHCDNLSKIWTSGQVPPNLYISNKPKVTNK